ASRTAFPVYIRSAVTRCERCASYAATIPKTPTSSFPSAAGQSVLLVSTGSSSASARPPRCLSRSTPTCFAMPVGSSSPTMATTRAPCSTISGTRTSSTRCATPKWRPIASGTFGVDRCRRRQARRRFPLYYLGIRARLALRQHLLDKLDRALDLLGRHVLDRIAMLDLVFAGHQQSEDLEICRRLLPSLGSMGFVLPETFVTRGQLIARSRRGAPCLSFRRRRDPPRGQEFATRCWSCAANWGEACQD